MTTQPMLRGTRQLSELEAIVERGLATFVEVGLALVEIRDRRLYRDGGHDSFESYCRHRWGFSRQHAHRLIEGARVAELVSPVGDIPTERIARELVRLVKQDPETARAVWAELSAHHGDHLTSGNVRRIVGGFLDSDAAPDFSPVDVCEQPRLDRRRPVICPECGHEFVVTR
ncbi:MAG: hypothetical protein ABSD85_17075 [Acidimicrobiales bacterium]